MRGIAHRRWLTLVGLLMAPGLGFSQADQQSGTLIVSGHSGQAPVTQINSRSYVAVDALARLMNGSLGYQGNQITLTLPAAASAAGTVLPASQPANQGLSKDFLNAGIETMSDIREWRSALLNAGENGYPVKDAWMDNYRAQTAKNLRLTSVAATTDSDRNALQLLSKEFDHMQELGNKILAARKKLSYITPDIVKKDPLDQKILNCARFLAAMAASGEFQDDGSCN
jgi:hypothetical protein